MASAKREMTFFLAAPEKRLLQGLASRLPGWVTSDHLTALGVAGALGGGAAYALSAYSLGWLWVASLMIAVNWFGDSLDGTLARVRHTERPHYGYYLDHNVDALSTAAIGVGLGLSPFVRIELALALVVLYLGLSINVYLESLVFGVFRMAYGRLGPTEVRITLILANALGFVATTHLGTPRAVAAVANVALAAGALGMLTMLAVRFGQNLHRLAGLEPQRTTPDAVRHHAGVGSPSFSR